MQVEAVRRGQLEAGLAPITTRTRGAAYPIPVVLAFDEIGLLALAAGHVLLVRHPDEAEPFSVRLGAFDSDPGVRPGYRQFVAYACAWEEVPDDGLPRHPESGRA